MTEESTWKRWAKKKKTMRLKTPAEPRKALEERGLGICILDIETESHVTWTEDSGEETGIPRRGRHVRFTLLAIGVNNNSNAH